MPPLFPEQADHLLTPMLQSICAARLIRTPDLDPDAVEAEIATIVRLTGEDERPQTWPELKATAIRYLTLALDELKRSH